MDSAFPFHFDSSYCGANIELSSSELTATSVDPSSSDESVVFGSGSFRPSRLVGGKLQWRILIERMSPLSCSAIHIGVTNTTDTSSTKRAWAWRSQKYRDHWEGKWKQASGMQKWKEGDILTLVVDCTASRAVLNLRIESQQSHTWAFDMEGFTSPFFWAYFYVNCGQKITLLPC